MARKAHKKSRNGCMECKRRRIKVKSNTNRPLWGKGYDTDFRATSVMRNDLNVLTAALLDVNAGFLLFSAHRY